MNNYYNYADQPIDWNYLVVQPLKNLLINVIAFIPDIITAILIVLAGWLIANIFKTLIGTCLKSVGFNKIAKNIGVNEVTAEDGRKIQPNQLVGLITFWSIMFISFIMMLSRLRLRGVSTQLDRLFSYVIIITIISVIAVIGIVLSMIVSRIVRTTAQSIKSSKADSYAAVSKWVILIFTLIICLSQVGIRQEMIIYLAAAIILTLCITFVLAFGFGGKNWAGKVLDKISKF